MRYGRGELPVLTGEEGEVTQAGGACSGGQPGGVTPAKGASVAKSVTHRWGLSVTARWKGAALAGGVSGSLGGCVT